MDEEFWKSVRQLQIEFERTGSAFRQAVDSLTSSGILEKLAEYSRQISDALQQLNSDALKYAKSSRAAQIIESAGWLPHPSLPVEEFAEQELDTLSATIGSFYHDNWSGVEEQFRRGFAEMSLQTDTVSALEEILQAHKSGLYRMVVRSVFPEIEKEIRLAFYSDQAGLSIASQKEFREALTRLPFGYVLQKQHDMPLYLKLRDHLYNRVAETNRLAVAGDPVPNRHAAMHGLVPYNSAQNSINALIMTDYILRLVSVMKKLRRNSP